MKNRPHVNNAPGVPSWTADFTLRRMACTRIGLAHGDSYMWNHYRRTAVDYERVLASQGGGCDTCGATSNFGSLFAWDHDHACCPGKRTCGKCVRGLLCTRCNTALDKLEQGNGHRLLAYLEKWANSTS